MGIFLLILNIIVQGAAGIIGQLIILRELPSIYYGNELSLGIILTSWLFWVAVGSGLIGKISYYLKNLKRSYTIITIISTFILLIVLISIRNLRYYLNITPGEILSFPFIVISSFLIVAPYAVLQGLLFTIAPRMYKQDKNIILNTNSVYLWEALGAFVGCIFYYFIGLKYFDSFQNVFIFNGLRLIPLLLLLHFPIVRKFRANASEIILLALIIFNFSLLSFKEINFHFYKKAYHPLTVIDIGESIYGNIVITKQSENNITFFENGLNLFTTDDIFTIEEATQFALLAHPTPRKVLLLGGGVNGCLRKIFAHPSVKHITYIELDPLLIKKAKDHLPSQSKEILAKPNVSIYYGDARYFIKRTKEKFDVIISQLPQPYTLQLNRFYTKEFFHEVKDILKDEGLFAFSTPSSENFINKNQALLLKSLYSTLKTSFKTIAIVPGNTNIFLAKNTNAKISLKSSHLVQTIKERNLNLKYINEFFLPARLSDEKINYVLMRLLQTPKTRINLDFNPISYYYDMILWSEVSYPPLQKLTSFLLNLNPIYFYFLICLIFFILFFINKKDTFLRHSLLLTVATVGLSEISLVIIIILLFQVFLGYIYSFIGIIIGGYMAGLTAGAFIGQKYSKRDFQETMVYKKIVMLELMIAVVPLFILLLSKFMHTYVFSQNIIQMILLIITIFTGIIGGMQFPYVNTLYLTNVPVYGKNIGIIYASDLLGSSLGAFLISSIVIPLFGIQHTLIFISFINILCFLFLLKARRSQ